MHYPSANAQWMKVYVIQCKNGFMMSVGANTDTYMCNPSTCNYEGNRTCKIGKYLDTKDCPCKKRVW